MAKKRRAIKPRWRLADVHRVVVATDEYFNQALYVDRRLKAESETFYCGDLDDHLAGLAFTFTTATFDAPGGWPDELPEDVDTEHHEAPATT